MDLLLEPGPTFQTQLDAAPPGAEVRLLPLEYAGPVVLRRPVSIDGQGATFWALQGPALAVDSDRVRLRRLRVESTGNHDPDSAEGCALLIAATRRTEFESVTVRGGVRGMAGEDGPWRLPDVLDAGRLEPGEEHVLVIRLYVPMACRLESGITGLTPEPGELVAGANEVRLRLEAMPADTLLHGLLTIRTAALLRTITFVAHRLSSQGEDEPRLSLLWQPSDWEDLVRRGAPEMKALPIPAMPVPASGIAPAVPNVVPPPLLAPVVPGAAPPLSASANLPPPQPPAEAAPGARRQGPLRTIQGPLVGSAFATPAAPAPEPEPEPAPPAPAESPAPKRPFRMKPLSRVFNQGNKPAAEEQPQPDKKD